jgi:hypothetical protein
VEELFPGPRISFRYEAGREINVLEVETPLEPARDHEGGPAFRERATSLNSLISNFKNGESDLNLLIWVSSSEEGRC